MCCFVYESILTNRPLQLLCRSTGFHKLFFDLRLACFACCDSNLACPSLQLLCRCRRGLHAGFLIRIKRDTIQRGCKSNHNPGQGSEYPIVVMPFMMTHYIMLQRNLLYTGVTRAKKILVLVGEKKAVNYAIRNNKAVARNTRLKDRIRKVVI